MDSAATEAKAREFLQQPLRGLLPVSPCNAVGLPAQMAGAAQYQQTRGTLAMLAQWISIAAQDAFRKARTEPLITLGSAPSRMPGFLERRAGPARRERASSPRSTPISPASRPRKALDADTKGAAARHPPAAVGAAILFESSGGQTDKVAHLPELRFALGEPELDTTTIDNAAFAAGSRAYFVRKVGSDGFRIGYQPTLKKVVSDRRASLDEETEVKPTIRKFVEGEFQRGASIPASCSPADSMAIPDAPRLRLVVADPETEWTANGAVADRVAGWTRDRGASPRLYPASLDPCLRRPGRELHDAVEHVGLAPGRQGASRRPARSRIRPGRARRGANRGQNSGRRRKRSGMERLSICRGFGCEVAEWAQNRRSRSRPRQR